MDHEARDGGVFSLLVSGLFRPWREIGHMVPRREWAPLKLVGASGPCGQFHGVGIHLLGRMGKRGFGPVEVPRNRVTMALMDPVVIVILHPPSDP